MNRNTIISSIAQLVVTNVQNGIVGTVPVDLAMSTNNTGNLFLVSEDHYQFKTMRRKCYGRWIFAERKRVQRVGFGYNRATITRE